MSGARSLTRRQLLTVLWLGGLLLGLVCVLAVEQMAQSRLSAHASGPASPAVSSATDPSASSASPTSRDYSLPQSKPGDPCLGGTKLSETNFKARFASRAWIPDAPVASDANLLDAWDCESLPALRYSGLTISFEPGWRVSDPRAWLDDAAKQWHRGSVITAGGRPAFVEPAEDGYGAELILFVGSVKVEAIATDLSITPDDLVSMIHSMRLPPT